MVREVIQHNLTKKKKEKVVEVEFFELQKTQFTEEKDRLKYILMSSRSFWFK